MTDSVIILYLQFLVRLISYFEKSGQRDLNKKNMEKFVKKQHIFW